MKIINEDIALNKVRIIFGNLYTYLYIYIYIYIYI